MPRPNQVFRYGGYEMRSHSETRWASMMDWLGIRWLYEPKVYHTRHGGYLPDFYLPDAGVFLEVKGPNPNQVEIDKGLDVESVTGKPVIFAHGKPAMSAQYLAGACLDYHGAQHRARVSLYEISRGIEKWKGLKDCYRFSLAGRIEEAPDSVEAFEVLMEIIDSWMTRQDIEKYRAAAHAKLNDEKMIGDTVTTMPAFLLLTFADRAINNRKREGA